MNFFLKISIRLFRITLHESCYCWWMNNTYFRQNLLKITFYHFDNMWIWFFQFFSKLLFAFFSTENNNTLQICILFKSISQFGNKNGTFFTGNDQNCLDAWVNCYNCFFFSFDEAVDDVGIPLFNLFFIVLVFIITQLWI